MVVELSFEVEVEESRCRDCGSRFVVKRDYAAVPDRPVREPALRVRALCVTCGRMLVGLSAPRESQAWYTGEFLWREEADPACELSWPDWIQRFDAGYTTTPTGRGRLDQASVRDALMFEPLLAWWRAGVSPELARVRWNLRGTCDPKEAVRRSGERLQQIVLSRIHEADVTAKLLDWSGKD